MTLFFAECKTGSQSGLKKSSDATCYNTFEAIASFPVGCLKQYASSGGNVSRTAEKPPTFYNRDSCDRAKQERHSAMP